MSPTSDKLNRVNEHSLPYRVLMEEIAVRHPDRLPPDVGTMLDALDVARDKVAKCEHLEEPDLDGYRRLLKESAEAEAPLKAILHNADLSAICFSGGGIRSASFGLGVLTQLARVSFGNEKGVLNQIDYLSTVSGGGYLGSWFTGWVRAKAIPDNPVAVKPGSSPNTGSATNHAAASQPSIQQKPSALNQVIAELGGAPPTSADPEPSPLRHLRDYTSYLAPRNGLLSADTWTLVAIFLRNLILNWGILVPAFAAVLFLPIFNTYLFTWVTGNVGAGPLLWTAGGFALIAFLYIAWHLPGNYKIQPTKASFAAFGIPLFLSAWCLAASFFCVYRSFLSTYKKGDPDFQPSFWLLFLVAVASHIGLMIGRIFRAREKGGDKRAPNFVRDVTAQFFINIVSALFAAWLLWLLARFAGPKLIPSGDVRLIVSLSVPLIFSVFALTVVLLNGLSSQFDAEEDREWWSRSGAFVLMAIIVWPLFHLLVLYSHEITEAAKSVFVIPGTVSIPALAGLIGALASWAGFSPATASAHAKADFSKLSKAGKFLSKREFLIPALGSLFFVLLGIALAQANDWLSGLIGDSSFVGIPVPGFVLAFLGAAALALVLNGFINVNTYSLHAMYRSRLVRSYLGASNPRRKANPFTNFDPGDNFPMKEAGADGSGPLHIINIALNMVATKKLAWQQRKAESFTISALHSGSYRVGYRPTKEYAGTKGLTLGTALAISGAAASPNMGYHSSPILSLVMTFFNARLGWWLPNPGPHGEGLWGKNSPVFSLLPLLNESLGQTTDEKRWVYLSDGGHFENLGLYEMVLRRCKKIIVVDGSADPGFTLEDLGNAIRKIFIDLGIPIDLEPAANAEPGKLPPSISLKPGTDAGNRHGFVFTIKYSCVDGTSQEQDGKLLYIKSSLNGNEPADVMQYARTHPEFPHESTANQFFNESQFESYVRLGAHVLEEIVRDGFGGDPPSPPSLDDLFNAVRGKRTSGASGSSKQK